MLNTTGIDESGKLWIYGMLATPMRAIRVEKGKRSMKIQIQKEKKTFPNKQKGKKREKKEKERKRNKRIGEKQQLEPFKIEQQIKLSNRGYR